MQFSHIFPIFPKIAYLTFGSTDSLQDDASLHFINFGKNEFHVRIYL